jgi:hemoglobin/transferrin/lactoferrin receptor protein
VFKPASSTVLDLYLRQVLGNRVILRAGVLNLTDVSWWHWSSVRGLPADDVLIPHLAQPGRSVAMSVGLKW